VNGIEASYGVHCMITVTILRLLIELWRKTILSMIVKSTLMELIRLKILLDAATKT